MKTYKFPQCLQYDRQFHLSMYPLSAAQTWFRFSLQKHNTHMIESVSHETGPLEGCVTGWGGDISRGTLRSYSRQVCVTAATSICMHGLTNKYTSQGSRSGP